VQKIENYCLFQFFRFLLWANQVQIPVVPQKALQIPVVPQKALPWLGQAGQIVQLFCTRAC
jgi:hypothetical protein